MAPERKRGAPRGNKNALKHGFYSSAFTARERRLLQGLPAADFSAEIELIRVANLHLIQSLVASPHQVDIETQLSTLRAIALSTHSIASLVRLQIARNASGFREEEQYWKDLFGRLDDPDSPESGERRENSERGGDGKGELPPPPEPENA